MRRRGNRVSTNSSPQGRPPTARAAQTSQHMSSRFVCGPCRQDAPVSGLSNGRRGCLSVSGTKSMSELPPLLLPLPPPLRFLFIFFFLCPHPLLLPPRQNTSHAFPPVPWLSPCAFLRITLLDSVPAWVRSRSVSRPAAGCFPPSWIFPVARNAKQPFGKAILGHQMGPSSIMAAGACLCSSEQ